MFKNKPAPIKIKIVNNFNYCCCKKKPLKQITIIKLISISIKPKRKEITMDPIIISMLPTDEVEQTIRYYAADNVTPKLVENPHFEDLPANVTTEIKNIGTFTETINGVDKTGTEVTFESWIDDESQEEDYAIRFEADPKIGEPEGELNYTYTMRVGSEAAVVMQNSVTVRPKTP